MYWMAVMHMLDNKHHHICITKQMSQDHISKQAFQFKMKNCMHYNLMKGDAYLGFSDVEFSNTLVIARFMISITRY